MQEGGGGREEDGAREVRGRDGGQRRKASTENATSSSFLTGTHGNEICGFMVLADVCNIHAGLYLGGAAKIDVGVHLAGEIGDASTHGKFGTRLQIPSSGRWWAPKSMLAWLWRVVVATSYWHISGK